MGADGKVYVGAGDDGYYCLSLEPEAPGKPRLIWHLPGEDYPDAETSLAVHNGKVYAGLGFGGKALCVLDAGSGKELKRVPLKYPAFSPPTISEGKDVGAVAAFSPVVEGRTLTFKPADQTTFQDQETGTIWSFLGHGLTGPLAGKRLDHIDHGAYFWFAVAAFYENARLLTGR